MDQLDPLHWVLLSQMLVSGVTFAVFGWDKRQARLDGPRVPERVLWRLAFFGGWPGGLLAMRVFRHKTQKVSFRRVFFSMVALHLLVVAAVAWLASTL